MPSEVTAKALQQIGSSDVKPVEPMDHNQYLIYGRMNRRSLDGRKHVTVLGDTISDKARKYIIIRVPVHIFTSLLSSIIIIIYIINISDLEGRT